MAGRNSYTSFLRLIFMERREILLGDATILGSAEFRTERAQENLHLHLTPLPNGEGPLRLGAGTQPWEHYLLQMIGMNRQCGRFLRSLMELRLCLKKHTWCSSEHGLSQPHDRQDYGQIANVVIPSKSLPHATGPPSFPQMYWDGHQISRRDIATVTTFGCLIGEM